MILLLTKKKKNPERNKGNTKTCCSFQTQHLIFELQQTKGRKQTEACARLHILNGSHFLPPSSSFTAKGQLSRKAVSVPITIPLSERKIKTLTKEQMIRGHWFLQLQKCFREEVASLQNYYYQSAFIAPAFFIAFQHTK